MRANRDLVESLLELQVLDRVPRMGYLLRGVAEAESVSEHSFHVAFLVWCLAPEIPEVDPLRALELSLVHDLAEVRLGDLPRTAARYLPPGSKDASEARAVAELLAPLGERATALHAEYRARETPEARLVKACDKLQLMLKVTHYEGWGEEGLAGFWDNPANFPDGGFEPVRRLFEALRERRSRKDGG